MDSPSTSNGSVNYNEMEIPKERINILNSSKLGQGTFGYVEKSQYRQDSSHDWRHVAIKYTADRKYNDLLIKEAKVMYTLKHDHCIQLYGIYRGNVNLGVVMEYMECKSLYDLAKNTDIEYKIDHVISWLYQLSSAVDYFHGKRHTHRDLKLQNLLLCDHYRTLKVCDFGTFSQLRETMCSMQGTPITMAPEVFKQHKYNHKVDIYSVGIIMWQLIARTDPYVQGYANVLLWRVTEGARPRDLTCHPILSKFYTRCWHDAPEERPESSELLEYFKLLGKIYQEGRELLIDRRTKAAAKSPQPNLAAIKKSHRRCGSDQTTMLRNMEISDHLNPPAPIRVTRSNSVTKTKATSNSHTASTTVHEDPDDDMLYDCIGNHLKPPAFIESDTKSQQILDEHVATNLLIYTKKQQLKQVLARKHSAVQQFQYLQMLDAQRTSLKAKMLELTAIRDGALKYMQDHGSI